MERETGFEPATSTLARWRSTTELLPLLLGHKYTGETVKVNGIFVARILRPDPHRRPTIASPPNPRTVPSRRRFSRSHHDPARRDPRVLVPCIAALREQSLRLAARRAIADTNFVDPIDELHVRRARRPSPRPPPSRLAPPRHSPWRRPVCGNPPWIFAVTHPRRVEPRSPAWIPEVGPRVRRSRSSPALRLQEAPRSSPRDRLLFALPSGRVEGSCLPFPRDRDRCSSSRPAACSEPTCSRKRQRTSRPRPNNRQTRATTYEIS